MSIFKILIVDDDKMIHKMMQLILSKKQFGDTTLELLFAKSGTEAIEILKEEENIELMFLDIVMETQNAGFEVLKYTRSVLKNNQIRIVIASGRTGDLPVEYMYLIKGIDGYMNKSQMDLHIICKAVEENINKKRCGLQNRLIKSTTFTVN